MKNLIILSTLLISIILTSCYKEEVQPTNTDKMHNPLKGTWITEVDSTYLTFSFPSTLTKFEGQTSQETYFGSSVLSEGLHDTSPLVTQQFHYFPWEDTYFLGMYSTHTFYGEVIWLHNNSFELWTEEDTVYTFIKEQ